MQDYIAQFEDIPGTIVFTSARCRSGFHLNQFCMSLLKSENRTTFKADEPAYLEGWKLTGEQRQAVLDRDYGRLIELGGNFYFLYKIAATDGVSAQQAVASMSGMSIEDYAAMMLNGGRSPEGQRSKRENELKLAA